MTPTILTIAGSDPTGGAGIQADLKTITSLGGYGAAAITCITVQNSLGVSRIEPLASNLVTEQVEAVLSDHFVTHIKIGMIGTGEIATAMGKILHNFQGEIIYDPVMAATTGHNLLETGALAEVKKEIIPRVTVLTPNIPELETLAGRGVSSEKEMHRAATLLFADYPALQCVIVKGGHGDGGDNLLTDYCYSAQGNDSITHEKIDTHNTHGTGCTLASALSVYHSKTGSYLKSFTHAIDYIQRLLAASACHTVIRGNNGQGPMLHGIIPSYARVHNRDKSR